MEFDSVIRGRRSIRAYKPEPVPEAVIREILDAARWTPSWRNTQAWNVWVLTGEGLARFKEEFRAAAERDEPPALDLRPTTDWPEACSARTTALMRTRAATLEAAGEPSDPRSALARMADVFGAPCLLVFGFDDCLAEAYASFDTGAFVQSVCLAAHDKGLGTCVVATVVRYPAILRELLPGAVDKRVVVAVTLGTRTRTPPPTRSSARAPGSTSS
ncbi:MAG: nitroreductase [Thermoleophilia bacterium]